MMAYPSVTTTWVVIEGSLRHQLDADPAVAKEVGTNSSSEDGRRDSVLEEIARFEVPIPEAVLLRNGGKVREA